MFENDFDKPKSVIIERRELTAKERTLMDMRVKIHTHLPNPKYVEKIYFRKNFLKYAPL